MKRLFLTRIRILYLLFLLGCSPLVYGQTGTVTGKIIDESGLPIIGANITVKTTTIGTITDANGIYLLKVPSGTVELLFSFIGYQSKTALFTIEENTTTEHNTILVEDLQALEEIVVIGYGTTKKSDLTGAVSTVSSENLTRRAVPSIDQALQGQVAGVDIVSNSGSPGATPTIRIRGVGTINNSDPIFVVDGLVMSPGGINFLNPNDIESVSVLKDASATAIYGAKGANGVIMVTTKKGIKGSMKVNINSYFGIQEVTNWISLMSGPDWAVARNRTSFVGDIYDPDTVQSTNWLNEISQRSMMKNTNISFSGGGENANYLVSFGYFDQQGVVKRTNFKRYTLRVNTDMQVKPWLKIGQNLQLSLAGRDFLEEENWYNGVVARAIAADPITPVRDGRGNYASLVNGNGNPLARMEMGLLDKTSKDSKIVGSFYADFKIIEGLNFKSTFGGELSFNEYKSYVPSFYFGPGDASDYPELYQNFGKNVYWQWENYVTYQKIMGIHNFTLTAGTSAGLWEWYNLAGQNKVGSSIESPSLEYFDNFSREGDVLGGAANHNSNFSYLGRLNYVLMDRYMFTTSVRRDGSSSFGKQNKFGTFPSFAFAWKINKESFLQNVGFLNSLKVRGSWGEIGNDKIGSWSYVGTIVSSLNYSEGNNLAEGSTTLKPANPSIRWETTRQTNVGFDAALFNNQIEINGEYFIRNTHDMLATIEPPLVSGIPSNQAAATNIGSVRNKGLELSIRYRKMEGSFNYEVGGYVSKIVNKVIDLGGRDVIITQGSYGQGVSPLSYTRERLPIASFYGYVTEGIFQDYKEINTHAFQNVNTAPGDFRFKDLNDDGKINQDDQTVIGSPHPDFTYGFNIFSSYKNFDLNLTFQGVYGGDIFAPYMSFTHNALSGSYNFHTSLNDSWTEEKPNNETPRIPQFDVNQNLRVSDYYIHGASYFRLKTIQLGYSLPESMTQKVRIERFRIYVGAQNLFTATGYTGNDPEVGYSSNSLVINVDVGTVPQPRVITFGFDLTF